MKRFALVSVLACMAVAAQAQTVSEKRTYVEVGYTAVSYEENALGYNVKSSPKAVRGLVGYELNDNVAIEAMAAAGTGYSDVDVTDQSVPGLRFKINAMYGLYVTPKAILADNLEGFVRLGYAHARGTATLDALSSSDTDSGFSYGVGIRYHFDKTTFLNVDYMSFLHKSDYKANGVTLGVGFKF
jgi:opacity protein-like surface antigen